MVAANLRAAAGIVVGVRSGALVLQKMRRTRFSRHSVLIEACLFCQQVALDSVPTLGIPAWSLEAAFRLP
jgi:hypothetical protein